MRAERILIDPNADFKTEIEERENNNLKE